MRRIAAAVCCVLSAGPAHAATWPGPAPCNGTLQACITQSADTFVLIGTNTPIDESISIGRTLSLLAANGYQPRFAPGRSIDVNFPGTEANVRLVGITLAQGSITARESGTYGTLAIERVRILSPAPAKPAIEFRSTNGAPVRLAVYDVDVDMTGSTADGIAYVGPAAAGATPLGFSSNFVRIHTETPSNANGLLVQGGGYASIAVTGVRVDGPFRTGIRLNARSSGVFVANNVVRGATGVAPFAAMRIDTYANTDLRVVNNTILDNADGLAVIDTEFPLAGRVANNLVAYNRGTGLRLPTGASLPNTTNLVFGNGNDAYTPGAGTVVQEPRLLHPSRPFPRPDSPAVGAGDNAAFDVPFLQDLDAAGSPRIKGANGLIDIGAFESGGYTFLHRAPGNTGHLSTLSPPAVAFMGADALPHVTQNLNPGNGATVSNARYVGLYLAGSPDWTVYNESLAPLPANAGFNVFVPATGANAFVEVAAATGPVPISSPGYEVNDWSDEIILATHLYNGGGTAGSYVNQPLAVRDSGGSAPYIVAANDASLPANAAYSIYAQPKSPTAFVHLVAPANVDANRTFLSHPLLDGQPCAKVSVTPRILVDIANPRPIGVAYVDGRHAIVNQDAIAMPIGAAFNVVIDEEQVARECADDLFGDSFENRGA